MSAVLDASAAIQLVLNGPHAVVVRAAVESEATILAPDLYVAEVANTLWKYVRAGHLATEAALASLADANELVTRFVRGEDLAAEALHEAVRLDHPVYDLLYLVTARREAATLVTCDQKLHRLGAAQGVAVAGPWSARRRSSPRSS